MKLTRRGFFGGVAASIAAACLPKLPAVQSPLNKWTQVIYGVPIIYLAQRTQVIMLEVDHVG